MLTGTSPEEKRRPERDLPERGLAGEGGEAGRRGEVAAPLARARAEVGGGVVTGSGCGVGRR